MKLTFLGNEVHLRGTQLKKGDKFPEFTAVKTDLSPLNLKDTKGRRVILSVPSLDTDVCSVEVAKFIQLFKSLPENHCYVVSMDLPFAQARWCQQNVSENVITASDYKERSFAEKTGTYVEELGLLTRAAFVLDEEGTIVYAEYVEEIATEPNYDAVMAALKA